MGYKKIKIDQATANAAIELKFFIDPNNTSIVHYDMRVFEVGTKIQEMDGVNNDTIVDAMALNGSGADQIGRKVFIYTKGFFQDSSTNNGNHYRVEAIVKEDGIETDKAVESCATNEPIGTADILIEFE